MPPIVKIFLITIFLMFISLLVYIGAIYIYSTLFGREEINKVAAEISRNETNQTLIVEKIIAWQDNKMFNIWKHMTTGKLFFPKPPYLTYLCKFSAKPEWIITTKCGSCGEYSVLFKELAEASKIESRIVHNSGENHQWNEVTIDNSCITVDPSMKIFNDSEYYERPNEMGGMGKQLSYVFYVDSGREHDITNRYTQTGTLIVNIERGNVPLENVLVIVKSRFLMDRYPSEYKKPIDSVWNYTDSNGTCKFNLGENNYTIVAKEYGIVVGRKAERILTLEENSEVEITLSPQKLFFPNTFYLLILAFLVIGLLIYFKKLSRSKKREK